MNGGRFDFDDGGTYCGGWEDGKAHGHGVCTGPKGQGEYAGAWHYGFEVSGIYTWPSGNTYDGQWQNGKRHGLGVERRGRWVYHGEWTQGYKGRYGARHSSNSQAKYEGTWSSGLQDGYGTETYADGGTYEGQWLRGMRHGYGMRRSAPFGVAAKFRSRSHAHASLTSLRSEQGDDAVDKDKSRQSARCSCGRVDGRSAGEDGDESRGGFVLRARSEPPQRRRRSLSERSLAVKRTILTGLRIKKQRSTGDINVKVQSATGSIRSSGSTISCTSDESAAYGGGAGTHHQRNTAPVAPPEEHVDASTTESYMGEWKNDKRSGFGVSERSDGLKYEGEWFNNKKFGYGVTVLKDGTREEGKYKNNVLVTSNRKKHLLFVRSSKLRERIDGAVTAAQRAAQIASQKADIAVSRTATAKDRAEMADQVAAQAHEDSDLARIHAKQFDPNFQQPGTETIRKQRLEGNHVPHATPPFSSAGPADSQPTGVAGGLPLTRQEAVDDATPPMLTPPEQPRLPPHDSAFGWQQSADKRGDHSPVLTVQTSVVMPVTPTLQARGGNPSPSSPFQLPNDASVPANPRHSSTAQPPQTVQFDIRGAEPATCSQQRFASAASPAMDARQLQYLELTDSASASANPSQSSSRVSLNQLVNDHFDQYMMAANPSAAKTYQANLLRQQHQPVHRAPDAHSPDVARSSASATPPPPPHLTRRSTLATSDRKDVFGANPPLVSRVVAADDTVSAPLDAADDETRGSLPDLSELDKAPVNMSREQVARMSSQRRQELQRMHEENELLRSNPLRYLFHPACRAWLARHKLILLVVLTNLCLALLSYQLLTYQRRSSADGDESGGAS